MIAKYGDVKSETVSYKTGIGAVAQGQLYELRNLIAGKPAPDITGGPWINSGSLSMETLRGRVVLVEFWTYG